MKNSLYEIFSFVTLKITKKTKVLHLLEKQASVDVV